jgi:hypothetical protein
MADDDLPDLHDIETPFDRRVSELIDAETTPFELVASLDERDLPMPTDDGKSRSPYPLAALVRVFLFHEISGKPIDGILNRLEENPDEATAFGFEGIPDTYGAGNVPDQSLAQGAATASTPTSTSGSNARPNASSNSVTNRVTR